MFFCEMVILVVFNSFNVVKHLKKPDPFFKKYIILVTNFILLANDLMSIITL